MLGLGIGGLVGGRLATRIRSGVRAYGWIEVVDRPVRAGGSLAARTAAGAEPQRARRHGLLAGGVLPLRGVARAAAPADRADGCDAADPGDGPGAERRRVGAGTGLLYGLNTLGAVAGVFLATFVLFPALGLTWTNRFGALLDVTVGVLALVFVQRAFGADTRAASPTAGRRAARDRRRRPPYRCCSLVYGCVGFTALLYEVAWSRALAVVFGSSIYAFSSMLGAFLSGIALGSLLFRRFIDASRAAGPAARVGHRRPRGARRSARRCCCRTCRGASSGWCRRSASTAGASRSRRSRCACSRCCRRRWSWAGSSRWSRACSRTRWTTSATRSGGSTSPTRWARPRVRSAPDSSCCRASACATRWRSARASTCSRRRCCCSPRRAPGAGACSVWCRSPRARCCWWCRSRSIARR